MAIVDFTTFTEVDPNNHIALTSSHIDFDAYRNEDAYIYRDYGEGYFGNLKHLVTVKAASGANSSYAICWMVANDLDDLKGLKGAGKKFLTVFFFKNASGTPNLFLRSFDGTTENQDYTAISLDTPYYLVVERSGASVTCKIYTDSDRTILHDTLTIDCPTDPFRYIYACNTENGGYAYLATLDIDDLDIDREVGAAYQYYRKITIDHTKVPGDLTDFPFLFNATDADLKTVANGGKIENTASGGASGSLTVPADLVFSPNQDGSNPYDFEVEKYDPATGELVAHVRIPSMSSSEDTVFYLIYGDSDVTTSQENVTGVWDTNFKMVHHMYDNAGGNVSDSTSNSNDGTKKAAGEPVETSSGRIGKAQDFDGSDDHIDVDSLAADVKTLQAWTIECSIKPENLSDGGMLFSMRDSDAGARPRINLDTLTGNDVVYEAVGADPDEFSVVASNVLTAITWYHIVLVADGAATTIYLDASGVASGAGNRAPGDITNAFAKCRIGERVYPGTLFPGVIDEYRVSSVARSADYITATYNNQSSPSTFHSLGSRQFVSPSFTYCKKITIDHTKVPGDLTDYPLLFNTTDADLKTVANGGKIENTASNGGASGSLTVPADLVFSPNLDGSDPYDFEVEKYDPATGELIAHVRIPSLSSSVDTVFYLVYGDSGVTTSQENVAGAWDSNFKAVWHFGETSGTYHEGVKRKRWQKQELIPYI